MGKGEKNQEKDSQKAEYVDKGDVARIKKRWPAQ